MGVLGDLMDRQETYRGILRDLKAQEDKSFADGIAMGQGIPEDSIVAVSCILYEMEDQTEDDEEPRLPRMNDLIWAIEFLDHLDTLGLKIVPK
jgi:hypothetical protein